MIVVAVWLFISWIKYLSFWDLLKINVTLFLCAFYHNLSSTSLNNFRQSIFHRYEMQNSLFEGNFKTSGFIWNYRATFQFGEGFLKTERCSNEENFVILYWFLTNDFGCVYEEYRYDEITVGKFLVQIDWQVHYEKFLTFFSMEITI